MGLMSSYIYSYIEYKTGKKAIETPRAPMIKMIELNVKIPERLERTPPAHRDLIISSRESSVVSFILSFWRPDHPSSRSSSRPPIRRLETIRRPSGLEIELELILCII